MADNVQEFGSLWTERKLDAVDDYLKAYMQIMSNQEWARLLYVDAFAGSGQMKLSDGRVIEGSALRSLSHSFDQFLFNDINEQRIVTLERRVKEEFPAQHRKIIFSSQDANKLLETLDSVWAEDRSKWRGVIFIDPFAMQLDWGSLESIAKTGILDVWYLFPIMALNRMLTKDGQIDESWKAKITGFLGTEEWEERIYSKAAQLNLFDNDEKVKLNIVGLRDYVISRFKDIFPTVSDHAVVLRNTNKSPLFILCFMASNPSEKARNASLRVANHLLKNLEELENGD